MREVFMYIAILALSAGWVIDHASMQLAQLHLKYRSQSVLYENDASKIVVTEHHKPGFMGMQVWQIWHVSKNGSEPLPLVTVNAGFQERQPTQPILKQKDEAMVITDKTESFVFAIDTHTFVKNDVRDYVYAGSFRYSIPPID